MSHNSLCPAVTLLSAYPSLLLPSIFSLFFLSPLSLFSSFLLSLFLPSKGKGTRQTYVHLASASPLSFLASLFFSFQFVCIPDQIILLSLEIPISDMDLIRGGRERGRGREKEIISIINNSIGTSSSKTLLRNWFLFLLWFTPPL